MMQTSRLYEINSSRVLQQIRRQPGISRIALAGELDLDRSTITKIVTGFLESGLVLTTEKFHGDKKVGRKATALVINPDFGLVLGIEAQTDFFHAVVTDLAGEIRDSKTFPYDRNKGPVEDQLADIIAETIRFSKKTGLPLLGVGIGLSGIVDPYNGRILHSNPLKIFSPYPLKAILEKQCGLPVFVENDANCCCWSEIAFGKIPLDRNFIAVLGEFRSVDISGEISGGFAVGIGIVIRGKVLHGDNFSAGEFRSLLYDYDKPSHVQLSLSDEEASRLPGDKMILQRVFDELAFNLSLPVSLFDITKILIAGDLSAHVKAFEPVLRTAIQKSWLYNDERPCLIEGPPGTGNAVSYGAAGLFISKLFSIPEMSDHITEDVGSILLKRILYNEI